MRLVRAVEDPPLRVGPAEAGGLLLELPFPPASVGERADLDLASPTLRVPEQERARQLLGELLLLRTGCDEPLRPARRRDQENAERTGAKELHHSHPAPFDRLALVTRFPRRPSKMPSAFPTTARAW